MVWFDWFIIFIPVIFVLGLAVYSRKYVHGVADFLSAGRLCGRYVVSVGDIANSLSIITLVAYIEVHYKTGFALGFWSRLTLPVTIIMGLTGYCAYRFRETKAMSLGQFLEMRYNRAFRIFASGLRSFSEILANMIMPAIGARFFIYFMGLPFHINIFGWQCPTFCILVFLILIIAISIICMGGTLALVITDAVQGMMLYPLLVVFIVFVLYHFSWTNEIVPVMLDRAPGESFMNPFDIAKLRDFNVFFLVITIFATVFHRASWIGAGSSTAAKSPHEQKMAGLLGTWRGAITGIFYVLIAVVIITALNHKNYAKKAKVIRTEICTKVADEIVKDPKLRMKIIQNTDAIPPIIHNIGIDPPLSQENNLDTPYLDATYAAMEKTPENNNMFQEFRTLYHQLTMAISMRNLLPRGMLGLFCLLLILAMVSTDDTRIYSAALTITQDVILPLKKHKFTPKQHIRTIRLVAISVGFFFVIGSFFMAQMDYINLFVTIVCSLWLGGCGPVMIFGLYSKFGTTKGAFTSLISGMVLSIVSILIKRNWADYVYPFLDKMNFVEPVGHFLTIISKPFNPYIVWKMNAIKCPINSYEFYFMIMLICLVLYCVVSKLTCKEPFNLERMLHRGIYNLDGEKKEKLTWCWKNLYKKFLGITNEYTTGDKVIAWAFFIYTFIYVFLGTFIIMLIWNWISPWPQEWWGHYFLVVYLVVPGIMSVISTLWFSICGVIDLFRLFRDLEARKVDDLDNGVVEGNVSISDKAKFEAAERARAVKAPQEKDLFEPFHGLEARKVDDLDNKVVEDNVSISDKAKFEAAEREKALKAAQEKEKK